MKKVYFLLLFMVCVAVTAQTENSKKVFGKVTDGKNAMENVNVSIIDKDGITATDADGKYEIQVETGDKVQFSYTGMRTVTIRIEDVTRVLNPIMIPDVTELDEVTVEASKRRSQKDMEEDYSINKSIIRTAWGYLDADRAAGNIRMLSEDEINPINICILNVLQNRFSGINIFGNCQTGGGVLIRGANSISNVRPAAFDVDGQIFTDTPIWIDVNNIKRIAVLANLATTATYGNIGAGGVVVINTIGGNPSNNEFVDRARLKNNYADGKELSRDEVAQNAPTYMKEFMKSDSFEESKAVFEKHHKVYSNSPYFLLDAYTHFVEVYNEQEYADDIIKKHFSPYTNNPVLMKALAYIYESQQRFEKANEAYKEVFILRPNYVQSYMDMANSYRDLREPKQAASIHTRYAYLVEEGFLEHDTIGFGPIIEREFNNLLMFEKGGILKAKKVKKLFVADEDFKGTRLVFEWNDSEAEFDLQFVNPENQYYKWKHNMIENSEVIELEKDFGYNVKEYLVDGALPGTWKVNVNYLGNKSLTPTYLKTTIYRNYGSPAQSKEVKVFKLSLKDVNQELFRLTTGSGIVVR
jgi:tetratricopeptide (TPR) repeat protein